LNEKEKTRLKQVSLPWAKPQPPPILLSRERPSSHPPHALQTRGVSNTQRSPSPPTQAQSSPSPGRPPSNELAKVSNALSDRADLLLDWDSEESLHTPSDLSQLPQSVQDDWTIHRIEDEKLKKWQEYASSGDDD
ncbi:hypothetical protein BT69DRAFT_1336415, partial [Atractiella rhizophila]